MVRILIADDHPIVREGLKQILSDTQDMQLAGEASNGGEVMDQVERGLADVVVLDISMPGESGLDVLRKLRARHPTLPVLMLSIHSEDQYAIRSLRAGASGYLTKESLPDELVTAIRRVAQGRRYVTEALAERLVTRLDSRLERPPHESLSDREYQVMRMIASGRALKRIATELGLSPKTVSTYRARVLEKTGLRNNAEITRYALQHDLIL
jgi:two-component system invasion response regulator UvrY